MLVLSRKVGERIVINNDIQVVVVSLEGNRCRLGVVAPAAVPVHRQEVYDEIRGRQAPPSTLTFTGENSGDNSLATELKAAATADFRGRHLVLDFTNVRRVSSVELGTLLGLHERLRSRGATLTLTRMDANVREVFAVSRLDSVLNITDGP